MTVRLTKRDVGALTPAAPRREVFAWCGSVPGFGVRATASAKTFVFQYREGKGRRARKRRLTIGRHGALTVDQARDIARGMAAAVARGEDPRPRKPVTEADILCVNDLLDRWATEAASYNARTGERRAPHNVDGDFARMNAHIRPTIGEVRLSELDREHIERLRAAITDGATARSVPSGKSRGVRRVRGGEGTATRTIRTFSAVCAYGVRRKLLTANPCEGVRLAAVKRRHRILSHAEFAQLASGLAQAENVGVNLTAIAQVRMLLATGARRQEVAAMRWKDIDLDNGVWRQLDTKTGFSLRPLSDAAQTQLSTLRQHADGSDWVFPRADGEGFYSGLSNAWSRIRALAGLPDDVTLHTLRHTFASLGAMANFPTALLKSVLGHKSEATTLRYQHIAQAEARAAASAVADQIARLMAKDSERAS